MKLTSTVPFQPQVQKVRVCCISVDFCAVPCVTGTERLVYLAGSTVIKTAAGTGIILSQELRLTDRVLMVYR